ncbi:MAG: hypothetical protein DMG97_32855 [Acidobacteria bacterium]|nr:MAG: hypothetical protein DMG97_32855 [Acidobacteriota bacterium]
MLGRVTPFATGFGERFFEVGEMMRASSVQNEIESIRVLVADSTPLTGRLIADALKRDRTFSVTNEKAPSLIATATTFKPDVSIISEQLEGKSGKGFEVLRQLRATLPAVRVVMLLDSAERELVIEAFRSGARGVFCRRDPLKMLARCVHKVYEGQLWVSGDQLELLVQALADAPATRLVDTRGTELLSKREQDVVRWLAEGHTNNKIARELQISENSVKNYLFRIFDKLGVSSRVEVVLYAANQSSSVQCMRPEWLVPDSQGPAATLP